MKALVATQNFDSFKQGDIVLKTEGDYVGYLLSNSHCVIVEFDSSIQFPKTVFHEAVIENEIEVTPAYYEIVEDQDQLKAKQINDLHAVMEQEVLAQMAVVFGTTNPESATAYKQTYDLMLAKPTMWVDKLGLTSEAAVIAYALDKVNAIDAYAVWRMERIAQFKTDRDAVLGA